MDKQTDDRYFHQHARDRGAYVQMTLVRTIPEFFIKPEYLTSCTVAYTSIPESGGKGGIVASDDHPGFAALRTTLHNQGYIHMATNSVNGDRVEKPFVLNGHRYTTGDQFSCASAQGCSWAVSEKNRKQQLRERRQQLRSNRQNTSRRLK